MTRAPKLGSLSLASLFDAAEANLLSPETMTSVHGWIKRYCADFESIFPVRQISGTERRELYRTLGGTSIAPADNSPAAALHGQLVRGSLARYEDLRDAIPRLPRHFHDLTLETANSYGWYIAHIFPAKNGDVRFLNWDRQEILRRFILALHPCNIFFVPGTKNRRVGEDPSVISYFAHRYAVRYAAIWEDFATLIDGRMPTVDETHEQTAVRIFELGPQPDRFLGSEKCVRTSYRATRLLFRKSEIEPLDWSDKFDIITPAGIFRLSKRDFYDTFSNVVKSRSYKQVGVYSYSVTPVRARSFLLPQSEA